MIKNIVIPIIVATVVSLSAPRNLAEVGNYITLLGVLVLRLGLALDPPRASHRGYDAGEVDGPVPYLEEARAASSEARA